MREFDIERWRMALRERILAATEIPNLYYQPPESVKLSYPCIIYSLGGVETAHANNCPYWTALKFDLLLIDKDPSSVYAGRLFDGLCGCKLTRAYTADNLNHWAFSIYL